VGKGALREVENFAKRRCAFAHAVFAPIEPDRVGKIAFDQTRFRVPRPAILPTLRNIILCGVLAVASLAVAQQRPTRTEIWDLKLGTPVEQLPDDFTDFACGTGGGPPSLALSGWRDFKRCRPQADGLREVYFRYDDELEYWAKANNFETEIMKYSGTKVFDFPVVLGARFDEQGVLKGIRIVSDPRDTSRDREEAYLLRNFLTARYGRDGWDCADLPPDEGETPVFRTFIKQRCKKTVEGGAAANLETNYYRKKGQFEIDPLTGRATEGQFESTVRFDLTLK
jgi:hypothetical protein